MKTEMQGHAIPSFVQCNVTNYDARWKSILIFNWRSPLSANEKKTEFASAVDHSIRGALIYMWFSLFKFEMVYVVLPLPCVGCVRVCEGLCLYIDDMRSMCLLLCMLHVLVGTRSFIR